MPENNRSAIKGSVSLRTSGRCIFAKFEGPEKSSIDTDPGEI